MNGRSFTSRTTGVRFALIAILGTLVSAFTASIVAQNPGQPGEGSEKKLEYIRRNFQAELEGTGQVVPAGRRCATGTPGDEILRRSRQGVALLRQRVPEVLDRKELKDIEVKVRFVVIHKGDQGKVSRERLDGQIEVLNENFAGSGFTFSLAEAEWHDVAGMEDQEGWFTMAHGSEEETEAKELLGQNQRAMLNFYTAEPEDLFGQSLLGWATFPAELSSAESKDGVVVLHSTLPGGSASPYNLGKTATHEVGHWLGLYHTFQGGCGDPNDEVADTPAQSDSSDVNDNDVIDIFECVDGLDTCADGPGKDPVHNYMNYPEDACLKEFTPGQIQRMRLQVAAFRPELILEHLPADLRPKLERAVGPFSKIGR